MKLFDPSQLKKARGQNKDLVAVGREAAEVSYPRELQAVEVPKFLQIFDAREVVRTLGMTLAVTALSDEEKRAYVKVWTIWAMAGGLLKNIGRKEADGSITPVDSPASTQTSSLWVLSARDPLSGLYWRSKLIEGYKTNPFVYAGDMALVENAFVDTLKSLYIYPLFIDGCEYGDVSAYLLDIPGFTDRFDQVFLYTTNGQCDQLVKPTGAIALESAPIARISLRSNTGMRVTEAQTYASWLLTQLEKPSHKGKVKFFDDLDYPACVADVEKFSARWRLIKDIGIRAYSKLLSEGHIDTPDVYKLSSYKKLEQCPLFDDVTAYELDVKGLINLSIPREGRAEVEATIAWDYLSNTGIPMPIDFIRLPVSCGVW